MTGIPDDVISAMAQSIAAELNRPRGGALWPDVVNGALAAAEALGYKLVSRDLPPTMAFLLANFTAYMPGATVGDTTKIIAARTCDPATEWRTIWDAAPSAKET